MSKLMYFYLKTCPYCIEAERWVGGLRKRDPKYAAVEIEYIEESEQKELADSYDYYYVPTYFLDGKKLHEGAATEAKIKAVLDAALR